MINYDHNLQRTMNGHPHTIWQFLARYVLLRLHEWAVYYADADSRVGRWLARWTDRKLYPKEN